MKVFELAFKLKDCKPGGSETNFNQLFDTDELALEFLHKKFPDINEITADVSKPWFINYTTRTFFYEAPRFDEDGDWDYPVEYTIELNEKEVITEL